MSINKEVQLRQGRYGKANVPSVKREQSRVDSGKQRDHCALGNNLARLFNVAPTKSLYVNHIPGYWFWIDQSLM